MYVRVLFLLCAFANFIKADYSSEAKYIDLLPEDEKTQFLNKIARRIISEIRSRSDTQKTSVEISDERLNEHDAYVKKIIDEESQDMKNIRRTEDDLKSERNDEVDFVELKVQPLEQNEPRGQESLENVDLSTSENKIRIKKGTPESNNERSKENTDKADDTLSTVPVHLLYDDTGNLQSTINGKKVDDTEYTANENLGHNNQILENTEKRSDKLIVDLKNESKDIESKDHYELNETLKNVSSPQIEENKSDNIPKAQTIIYDFEPKLDDVTEYRNYTTEKSSEIVRAKQFELDEASDKWIEIQPKNVTEDQLKASTVVINAEEVTVNNENDIFLTSDLTSPVTNHTNTDYISNTSELNVKIFDDAGGSTTQNVEAISSKKTVEINSNVTESYLQPATPSSIYNTEFGNKDKESASTINVRSVSNEGENEGPNLSAEAKSSLRLNQEDLNVVKEQLQQIDNPHPYFENNNRYQIIEIAQDKPFVPSKQINAGYDEAPYYVPVYNYASDNAFYNPYNRFGPNNGNNPEVIEVDDSYNNKGLSYDLSKLNSEPKHKRIHFGANEEQANDDQGQRKSKYYQNEDEYDIDNKIPYQKIPVMKGKVINIHFNPNDYLDMDYYLGRSINDNPEPPPHVVKKGKPLDISYSQDTSSEGVDPISKQPYNMKNVISNIRLQMNSLKMQNKSKTMRSHRHKLQDKLRIVDKILGNPIFRGLNNSLVLFIPKTRTKNIGTEDFRDNIAVDYYFSRMSSGEVSHSVDEVGTQQGREVSGKDIAQIKKNIFLKTNKKKTQPSIEDQKPNIPLKLDNVIDLAMKVKKPKQNDFEILLNAFLNVLKDMVDYDNERLVRYDWLGSAVDVQSALDKLITLSDIMHVTDDVHRYDRELFRYVLFIFKTSLKSLAQADAIEKGSKRKSGKDHKNKMVADANILHQFEVWQEVKTYMREMRNLNIDVYDYLLQQFEAFLLDLRNNLNELHEAIKGIASVTKYNRQRWFVDLKELFLSPLDRKASLAVLLHLASTRLFALIEESARDGLEDNFVLYVRTHKTEVERTSEEFLLVLRLLRELNRLKK